MALHFPRSNALLLLVPKTGSTWIRAKLDQLELAVENVGDPAMRGHDLLDSYDRSRYRYVGGFVRDPIEWYRSYWAYRMERGWRPQYPLDEHCQCDDFETFVRHAVSILPGALGNIYRSYVGPPDNEIEFVGRQERLEEDLISFLRMIGENVDEALLRRGPRINVTTTRPDYPEELKELITLSEWDTMRRFGYLANRSDPVGLAEMQERFPEHADEHRLLTLWTEKIHWRPDDAKKKVGQAVRAQTRYARVHSNFALLAQHKHGDTDYAEDRYRRALELDPQHPRTLCNYALLVWRHKNDQRVARKLMLRALSGRPNHPYTLGKLARLTYRELRDPELAEVLYRQSLAGNNRQQDVAVELADLLVRHGKPDEAVSLLRTHADRPDASRLTLVALATMLLRTGGNLAEAQHFRDRAAIPPVQDIYKSEPQRYTIEVAGRDRYRGRNRHMRTNGDFSPEQIMRNLVATDGKSRDTVIADTRTVLNQYRICLVRGFPTDPDIYLEFLRGFGTPLANYSSRSDLAKDGPHPQINQVKYKPKGQYNHKSVHYVAGELLPHSARSWCTPRPAFFAMLMVNPGWRDTAEGERGESIVLSWQHLFTRLAERDSDVFTGHFDRLSRTPIRFQANNVREELSDLPVCYPLHDATGRYDVGVRLKQDLPEKILNLKDEILDFDDYQQAVDYLVTNAADRGFQACFPMSSGDLLIFDNNRFSHGRRKIIGERLINGVTEVNPRELWSVTVR